MKNLGYALCLLSGTVALLVSCEKMGLREEPILDVPDSLIEIDGNHQTFPIEVNTNVDFTIDVIDADWLRPVDSVTKSVEQIQKMFVVDENKTGYSRKTKVSFKYVSKDGKEWKEEVEISQSSLAVNTFFSILFSGNKFFVPRLNCYYNRSFEGIVDFGDGEKAKYKRNLEHVYGKNDRYTIFIEGENAYKVKFDNISGVEEIDLSLFAK